MTSDGNRLSVCGVVLDRTFLDSAAAGALCITTLDCASIEMQRPVMQSYFSAYLVDHFYLIMLAVSCFMNFFCYVNWQEGFSYHHAESSYLMLVQWISKSENKLPANASHRVGIGAFVTNSKGEVLLLQLFILHYCIYSMREVTKLSLFHCIVCILYM